MTIMKANTEHISEVARLFDLYRQFYDCESDSALATQFIKERIENDESDIFLTIENNHACGFVQLYPSFCSIQAAKIFILEDLYVEAQYRKTGLGESLMQRAAQWAREKGAARLDLLTAKTNNAGQSLYEKLGYRKVNQDFYAYSLDVL